MMSITMASVHVKVVQRIMIFQGGGVCCFEDDATVQLAKPSGLRNSDASKNVQWHHLLHCLIPI